MRTPKHPLRKALAVVLSLAILPWQTPVAALAEPPAGQASAVPAPAPEAPSEADRAAAKRFEIALSTPRARLDAEDRAFDALLAQVRLETLESKLAEELPAKLKESAQRYAKIQADLTSAFGAATGEPARALLKPLVAPSTGQALAGAVADYSLGEIRRDLTRLLAAEKSLSRSPDKIPAADWEAVESLAAGFPSSMESVKSRLTRARSPALSGVDEARFRALVDALDATFRALESRARRLDLSGLLAAKPETATGDAAGALTAQVAAGLPAGAAERGEVQAALRSVNTKLAGFLKSGDQSELAQAMNLIDGLYDQAGVTDKKVRAKLFDDLGAAAQARADAPRPAAAPGGAPAGDAGRGVVNAESRRISVGDATAKIAGAELEGGERVEAERPAGTDLADGAREALGRAAAAVRDDLVPEGDAARALASDLVAEKAAGLARALRGRSEGLLEEAALDRLAAQARTALDWAKDGASAGRLRGARADAAALREAILKFPDGPARRAALADLDEAARLVDERLAAAAARLREATARPEAIIAAARALRPAAPSDPAAPWTLADAGLFDGWARALAGRGEAPAGTLEEDRAALAAKWEEAAGEGAKALTAQYDAIADELRSVLRDTPEKDGAEAAADPAAERWMRLASALLGDGKTKGRWDELEASWSATGAAAWPAAGPARARAAKLVALVRALIAAKLAPNAMSRDLRRDMVAEDGSVTPVGEALTAAGARAAERSDRLRRLMGELSDALASGKSPEELSAVFAGTLEKNQDVLAGHDLGALARDLATRPSTGTPAALAAFEHRKRAMRDALALLRDEGDAPQLERGFAQYNAFLYAHLADPGPADAAALASDPALKEAVEKFRGAFESSCAGLSDEPTREGRAGCAGQVTLAGLARAVAEKLPSLARKRDAAKAEADFQAALEPFSAERGEELERQAAELEGHRRTMARLSARARLIAAKHAELKVLDLRGADKRGAEAELARLFDGTGLEGGSVDGMRRELAAYGLSGLEPKDLEAAGKALDARAAGLVAAREQHRSGRENLDRVLAGEGGIAAFDEARRRARRMAEWTLVREARELMGTLAVYQDPAGAARLESDRRRLRELTLERLGRGGYDPAAAERLTTLAGRGEFDAAEVEKAVSGIVDPAFITPALVERMRRLTGRSAGELSPTDRRVQAARGTYADLLAALAEAETQRAGHLAGYAALLSDLDPKGWPDSGLSEERTAFLKDTLGGITAAEWRRRLEWMATDDAKAREARAGLVAQAASWKADADAAAAAAALYARGAKFEDDAATFAALSAAAAELKRRDPKWAGFTVLDRAWAEGMVARRDAQPLKDFAKLLTEGQRERLFDTTFDEDRDFVERRLGAALVARPELPAELALLRDKYAGKTAAAALWDGLDAKDREAGLVLFNARETLAGRLLAAHRARDLPRIYAGGADDPNLAQFLNDDTILSFRRVERDFALDAFDAQAGTARRGVTGLLGVEMTRRVGDGVVAVAESKDGRWRVSHGPGGGTSRHQFAIDEFVDDGKGGQTVQTRVRGTYEAGGPRLDLDEAVRRGEAKLLTLTTDDGKRSVTTNFVERSQFVMEGDRALSFTLHKDELRRADDQAVTELRRDPRSGAFELVGRSYLRQVRDDKGEIVAGQWQAVRELNRGHGLTEIRTGRSLALPAWRRRAVEKQDTVASAFSFNAPEKGSPIEGEREALARRTASVVGQTIALSEDGSAITPLTERFILDQLERLAGGRAAREDRPALGLDLGMYFDGSSRMMQANFQSFRMEDGKRVVITDLAIAAQHTVFKDDDKKPLFSGLAVYEGGKLTGLYRQGRDGVEFRKYREETVKRSDTGVLGWLASAAVGEKFTMKSGFGDGLALPERDVTPKAYEQDNLFMSYGLLGWVTLQPAADGVGLIVEAGFNLAADWTGYEDLRVIGKYAGAIAAAAFELAVGIYFVGPKLVKAIEKLGKYAKAVGTGVGLGMGAVGLYGGAKSFEALMNAKTHDERALALRGVLGAAADIALGAFIKIKTRGNPHLKGGDGPDLPGGAKPKLDPPEIDADALKNTRPPDPPAAPKDPPSAPKDPPSAPKDPPPAPRDPPGGGRDFAPPPPPDPGVPPRPPLPGPAPVAPPPAPMRAASVDGSGVAKALTQGGNLSAPAAAALGGGAPGNMPMGNRVSANSGPGGGASGPAAAASPAGAAGGAPPAPAAAAAAVAGPSAPAAAAKPVAASAASAAASPAPPAPPPAPKGGSGAAPNATAGEVAVAHRAAPSAAGTALPPSPVKAPAGVGAGLAAAPPPGVAAKPKVTVSGEAPRKPSAAPASASAAPSTPAPLAARVPAAAPAAPPSAKPAARAAAPDASAPAPVPAAKAVPRAPAADAPAPLKPTADDADLLVQQSPAPAPAPAAKPAPKARPSAAPAESLGAKARRFEAAVFNAMDSIGRGLVKAADAVHGGRAPDGGPAPAPSSRLGRAAAFVTELPRRYIAATLADIGGGLAAPAKTARSASEARYPNFADDPDFAALAARQAGDGVPAGGEAVIRVPVDGDTGSLRLQARHHADGRPVLRAGEGLVEVKVRRGEKGWEVLDVGQPAGGRLGPDARAHFDWAANRALGLDGVGAPGGLRGVLESAGLARGGLLADPSLRGVGAGLVDAHFDPRTGRLAAGEGGAGTVRVTLEIGAGPKGPEVSGWRVKGGGERIDAAVGAELSRRARAEWKVERTQADLDSFARSRAARRELDRTYDPATGEATLTAHYDPETGRLGAGSRDGATNLTLRLRAEDGAFRLLGAEAGGGRLSPALEHNLELFAARGPIEPSSSWFGRRASSEARALDRALEREAALTRRRAEALDILQTAEADAALARADARAAVAGAPRERYAPAVLDLAMREADLASQGRAARIEESAALREAGDLSAPGSRLKPVEDALAAVERAEARVAAAERAYADAAPGPARDAALARARAALDEDAAARAALRSARAGVTDAGVDALVRAVNARRAAEAAEIARKSVRSELAAALRGARASGADARASLAAGRLVSARDARARAEVVREYRRAGIDASVGADGSALARLRVLALRGELAASAAGRRSVGQAEGLQHCAPASAADLAVGQGRVAVDGAMDFAQEAIIRRFQADARARGDADWEAAGRAAGLDFLARTGRDGMSMPETRLTMEAVAEASGLRLAEVPRGELFTRLSQGKQVAVVLTHAGGGAGVGGAHMVNLSNWRMAKNPVTGRLEAMVDLADPNMRVLSGMDETGRPVYEARVVVVRAADLVPQIRGRLQGEGDVAGFVFEPGAGPAPRAPPAAEAIARSLGPPAGVGSGARPARVPPPAGVIRVGKVLDPALLPESVYSPEIMATAREHGLVFDAAPGNLTRLVVPDGVKHNFVIVRDPDGRVGMTVGRVHPGNAQEVGVKHAALGEGREVLFSGEVSLDKGTGRPVLDFNSGTYSSVGLDARWKPTPENARALALHAEAILGGPVVVMDHFAGRAIDFRRGDAPRGVGAPIPKGYEALRGEVVALERLNQRYRDPAQMAARRAAGELFELDAASLDRVAGGADLVHNYVIVREADGSIGMTVGRYKKGADELGVKHAQLANGREVLFSGELARDPATGRVRLDFNSGTYSNYGRNPRWAPTPENAAALAAHAQAILGREVAVFDHFRGVEVPLDGTAARPAPAAVPGRPVGVLSPDTFRYNGPIRIEAGAKTFEIISYRDLAARDPAAAARVNKDIDFYLIDPADPARVKALRDGEVVLVGRDNPGRFALPDLYAPRHFEVARTGDGFAIQDLGSYKGTKVAARPEPMPGRELAAEKAEFVADSGVVRVELGGRGRDGGLRLEILSRAEMVRRWPVLDAQLNRALDRYIVDPSDPSKFKGLRPGEEVNLGRESQGRFAFGPDISRRHLTIRRVKDGYELVDRGSTNGTRVLEDFAAPGYRPVADAAPVQVRTPRPADNDAMYHARIFTPEEVAAFRRLAAGGGPKGVGAADDAGFARFVLKETGLSVENLRGMKQDAALAKLRSGYETSAAAAAERAKRLEVHPSLKTASAEEVRLVNEFLRERRASGGATSVAEHAAAFLKSRGIDGADPRGRAFLAEARARGEALKRAAGDDIQKRLAEGLRAGEVTDGAFYRGMAVEEFELWKKTGGLPPGKNYVFVGRDASTILGQYAGGEGTVLVRVEGKAVAYKPGAKELEALLYEVSSFSAVDPASLRSAAQARPRGVGAAAPPPPKVIVRTGTSRGEGWSVDGKPATRLSGGAFKEVLLHPSDDGLVMKLFSQAGANDTAGSLSEKRLELRQVEPLAAIGRAPRVVDHGAVLHRAPSGERTVGFVVQEKIVGRELGDLLADPATRTRALAETRALFDDLIRARIKLEDRVKMHENISVGRARGQGPEKAWVLDAGEAVRVPAQGRLDALLGRADPLRAYYDSVYAELAARGAPVRVRGVGAGGDGLLGRMAALFGGAASSSGKVAPPPAARLVAEPGTPPKPIVESALKLDGALANREPVHGNVHAVKYEGRDAVLKVDAHPNEGRVLEAMAKVELPDNVRVPRALAESPSDPMVLHRLLDAGGSRGSALDYSGVKHAQQQGRSLLVMERLPDDFVSMHAVMNGSAKLKAPIAAKDWQGLLDSLDALGRRGLGFGDLQNQTNIRVRQVPDGRGGLRTEFALIDAGQGTMSGRMDPIAQDFVQVKGAEGLEAQLLAKKLLEAGGVLHDPRKAAMARAAAPQSQALLDALNAAMKDLPPARRGNGTADGRVLDAAGAAAYLGAPKGARMLARTDEGIAGDTVRVEIGGETWYLKRVSKKLGDAVDEGLRGLTPEQRGANEIGMREVVRGFFGESFAVAPESLMIRHGGELFVMTKGAPAAPDQARLKTMTPQERADYALLKLVFRAEDLNRGNVLFGKPGEKPTLIDFEKVIAEPLDPARVAREAPNDLMVKGFPVVSVTGPNDLAVYRARAAALRERLDRPGVRDALRETLVRSGWEPARAARYLESVQTNLRNFEANLAPYLKTAEDMAARAAAQRPRGVGAAGKTPLVAPALLVRTAPAAAHYFDPPPAPIRAAEGIKGAHEKSLFLGALNGRGRVEGAFQPVPGFDGLEVASYRMYKMDGRGGFTSQVKGGAPLEKTLVDGAKWPLARVEALADRLFGRAARDGTHEATLDGVTFIGWVRGGELKSFGVKDWVGRPRPKVVRERTVRREGLTLPFSLADHLSLMSADPQTAGLMAAYGRAIAANDLPLALRQVRQLRDRLVDADGFELEALRVLPKLEALENALGPAAQNQAQSARSRTLDRERRAAAPLPDSASAPLALLAKAGRYAATSPVPASSDWSSFRGLVLESLRLYRDAPAAPAVDRSALAAGLGAPARSLLKASGLKETEVAAYGTNGRELLAVLMHGRAPRASSLADATADAAAASGLPGALVLSRPGGEIVGVVVSDGSGVVSLDRAQVAALHRAARTWADEAARDGRTGSSRGTEYTLFLRVQKMLTTPHR